MYMPVYTCIDLSRHFIDNDMPVFIDFSGTSLHHNMPVFIDLSRHIT